MRRVLAVGALFAALLISTAPAALAGGDPNGGSSSDGSAHHDDSASCHLRGKLPDPKCTPGSVNDAVKQDTIKDTICKPGWATKARPSRSVMGHLKTQVMKSYGISDSARPTTEADHLIPLSLGGNSAVTNVWPEPSDIPHAGFRNTKDKLEAQLNSAVCSGKVKLAAAQSAVAGDWTTALHKLGIG